MKVHRLMNLLIVYCCLFMSNAMAETTFQDRLRHRLEYIQSDEPDATASKGLTNVTSVLNLYDNLSYRALWFDNRGQPDKNAVLLLNVLSEAPKHGLSPEDYHHSQITAQWDREASDTLGKAIELELLMTDAFLLYSSHMIHGKVDPEGLAPPWQIDDTLLPDVSQILKTGKESDLKDWFTKILPKSNVYNTLVHELERISRNGKPSVVLKSTLKPGQSHEEVNTLISILKEFDYLKAEADDAFFSNEVKAAVIQFQEQHSLETDGIVGAETRQALNALYAGDEDKIRVNLERWRWMPERLEESYILVNIAGYTLRYVHNKQTQIEMKTVVGRRYRKTPVFSEQMRFMVVNPSWSVPRLIATKDLLPKIKADPDYFNKMNMQLFEGWGSERKRVAPESVDWENITPTRFPFHILQLPGEKNALGKVKFMFPNEHSVYLHDTNDKSLFQKSSRAFSSGCIRLEKPIELLEAITQNHTDTDVSKVKAILSSSQETTVMLKQALPVHIQYWTVWADDESRVHYRQDIYERDKPILNALTATRETGKTHEI